MRSKGHRLYRKLAALCCAGVLFQAASCQTTLADLTAQFAAATVTNVITDFIFSLFGLTP